MPMHQLMRSQADEIKSLKKSLQEVQQGPIRSFGEHASEMNDERQTRGEVAELLKELEAH